MRSPSLVTTLVQNKNAFDHAANENLFISDRYCHGIYDAHQQWLLDLDKQPQALLHFLSQRSSSKLGYYFENLIAWWLSQKIAGNYFESHVKVSAANRDIGEFDFLFRAGKKFEHWEAAVKYYLYFQERNGSVSWYGPNAKDTLSKKLERLLSHQIQLSKRSEARPVLSGKGIDEVDARIFIKGYLFYPIDMDFARLNGQVADCELSPGHLKGWWISIDKLSEQQLNSFSARELRWSLLPRLEWLAPRVFSSEQAAKVLLPGEQIFELLKEQFSQSSQSSLIAGYSINKEGCWEEESRGFVVGENWPS